MKQSEYSVVIAGSGIAGLYTALKLSKKIKPEDKILIITKSPLGESNSRYAQGGIAGIMPDNNRDSVELHTSDTIKAGAGLSEKEVVTEISEASGKVINDLISYGVVFDTDNKNNFTYTLAGAHSVKRVLHCCNDATGRSIIDVLVNSVKNTPNICIMEKAMAVELLTTSSGNECIGAIVYNKITKEHEIIYTSNFIIATGGAGQIYKYTTNPYGATGDGIAISYEAGAEVQDIEFIQFHPTALVINPNNHNRFLISEAVRGEGAKLVNNSGEEFMHRYSEKGELAPRDIVTRAIFSEILKENSSNVYLNISNLGYKNFTERFPHIAKKCEMNGIDITKNLIPVAPAAHYMMGGIKADINGNTSLKGLYAIGEAASTGFHGANRLACNSLLECAVCAYELSNNLTITKPDNSKKNDKKVQHVIKEYTVEPANTEYDDKTYKDKLRDIMWNNVGIIRSNQSLQEAAEQVNELKKEFKHGKRCNSAGEYEYRNMLAVAGLIINAAIKRKESRGAHYNKDYPQADAPAKHSNMSLPI